MARLVLWCLNRTAEWDAGPLERALRQGGHEVRRGDRTVDPQRRHSGFAGWVDEVVHRSGREPPHGLMYEGRFSEYFVPIVVKCVGDASRFLARFGSQLTPEGRQRFEQVLRAAPLFYEQEGRAPSVPWTRYWDLRASTNAMMSPMGMGLYEVLAEERRPGERAVLVGYSQGGLVAVFLAWLDELFDEAERKVAAVVAVQSPLRGSPFAHPRNANVVAQALFGAALGAAGYPIVAEGAATFFPHLRHALEELTDGRLVVTHTGVPDVPSGARRLPGSRHFDIDAVTTILDRLLAAERPAGRKDGWDDPLWTARRWLSGLSLSATPTAFQDLSPSDLDAPGTVLHCLAETPLSRTWHGAVVGTNNTLSNFVVEFALGHVRLPRFIIEPILRGILKKPTIAGMLQRAMDPVSLMAMNNLARGNQPVRGPHEEAVSQAYLQGGLVSGVDQLEWPLNPHAHDFVIPAVSQAVVTRSDRFVGNVVNERATHMSGAQSDGPFVHTLLKVIANRIAGE